jgi:hypothetical protein
MEKHLIESAKEYSAKTGKSLSRLVADFFELIRHEHLEQASQLSPTVQSLKGALKDSGAAAEDYKK